MQNCIVLLLIGPEKVVSYLVDNSISACPVTSSNLNKGQIRQIDGYAILSEIALLLKDNGDAKIKDYLNRTSRTYRMINT